MDILTSGCPLVEILGFRGRVGALEVEWGAAVERRKRASECTPLYRKHLKMKTNPLSEFFLCMYRASQVVVHLGWVDLDLGFSPILPGQ